jgi:hypothetical protein
VPSFAAPTLNFTGAYIAPGVLGIVLNFGAAQAAVDPAALSAAIAAPAPVLSAQTDYDANVLRPLIGARGLGWERGVAAVDDVAVGWQRTLPEPQDLTVDWQRGQPAARERFAGFGRSLLLTDDRQVYWARGLPLGDQSELLFDATLATGLRLAALWGRGVGFAHEQALLHKDTLKVHQEKMALRWGTGLPQGRGFGVRAEPGKPLNVVSGLAWGLGAQPLPGRYTPPTGQPPIPPVYLPPGVRDVLLNFVCKYDLRTYSGVSGVLLNFGRYACANAAVLQILPARFYMTINTVQAQLLPGLAEVPLYPGCTISQDVGSYGWTLSATGPASIHAQLAPAPGVPKQLRVTINGIAWVFAIDNPRKSQSFGNTVTQITGRSVTAALGPAFAREAARLATSPYNAQQLAAQALENTGIALDWGIDDWLVPAGAWSHYGTPLAAVQAIAQAAGGYVQSHRSLPELQVRHPYPLLPGGILGGPWNWGGAFAADVNLAPDAIVSRSTEVRESPVLNAVYVSGTTQGVLALIKREGTAGELLGAQINDALITANVAARQRGLAVLGAAGGRVMHQLELPVLVGVGQPGVLSTDQLIQVNDAVPWRGRVRAVSVTGGRPSVRQTVLVEAA